MKTEPEAPNINAYLSLIFMIFGNINQCFLRGNCKKSMVQPWSTMVETWVLTMVKPWLTTLLKNGTTAKNYAFDYGQNLTMVSGQPIVKSMVKA